MKLHNMKLSSYKYERSMIKLDTLKLIINCQAQKYNGCKDKIDNYLKEQVFVHI